MAALTGFREAAQEIYAKYDTYLVSLCKFVLAFAAFLSINIGLGYMDRLNSIFVVLILALLCSFLPTNAIVLLGTALILAHLYALSLPALIVGGGIILILVLLYFSTGPRESYPLILTMVALGINVPCAVPLVLGLVSNPFAAFPLCFGTIAYYTLHAMTVSGQAVSQAAESELAIVDEIRSLLDAVASEKQLVLMTIALLAVLLIVYLVRRMAVKYAWTLAVTAGTLTFFVIYAVGSLILGVGEGFLWIIIGTVVSALAGYLVQVFLFHVDYTRTQSVQFEDGEYYYYVKAIPKIKKGRDKSGEY